MSETQLRPIPAKPPRMPNGMMPTATGMPTQAARGKITISSDDLHSNKVEDRLQQQEAVTAAQSQYQRQTPSALDMTRRSRDESSLWFSTILNMAAFGLIGGLLAWGCGELRYSDTLVHDDRAVAQSLMLQMHQVLRPAAVTAQATNDSLNELREEGKDNPYFQVASDEALSPAEREQRFADLQARDHRKFVIADMLYYGACGMFIALALGVAEPISSRNYRGAITNGAAGAAVGLVGGVLVSLFVNHLYQAISGKVPVPLGRAILANMVGWGVLGLFLDAAPGIVLRNRRKFLVGVIGGLIGGLIGGALYEPVRLLNHGQLARDDTLGRLVAMVAIGVIAGAATGWIENAAKSGWMKVTSGLIAGKQFILYRNPTFIGSSPQCQIYLFKDPKIGRRHAAVHVQPHGYYLEDLGTGSGTMVNDQPVARVRLRHGDRVQIGATTFAFREKRKTA